MSRTRSARRNPSPHGKTGRYPDQEIDRRMVISFLEIEPEVSAALHGEAHEIARAVTATHESAADKAYRSQFEPESRPASPAYRYLEEELDLEEAEAPVEHSRPRVIDVTPAPEPVQPARATVHRISLDELPPRRTRQAKHKLTRETKKARRRAERARRAEELPQSEQPAAEALPPSEQVAAAEALPASERRTVEQAGVVRWRARAFAAFEKPAAAGQVAAVEQPPGTEQPPRAADLAVAARERTRDISTRVETVAHHSNPMGVALEVAVQKKLPFAIPDYSKMIVQIRNGMKPPALARLSWDYMNFSMPPRTDLHLSPRQRKREEWKAMKTYFRINPYKSHYKQDQRTAKRLVNQVKRAGLDLA